MSDTTTADVFDHIYLNRVWGDSPPSGPGSNEQNTRVVASRLPQVLRRLNIKSVIDCGCGGLDWMTDVDLDGVSYVGYDVSPAVVDALQKKFPDHTLEVKDICEDPLPSADLAISRDVLVHLPFDLIKKFFANLKSSEVKYLAATCFPSRSTNEDCGLGYWRTLNFEVAPFNLPVPIATINERLNGGHDEHCDKSICVWRVADLGN